jgi:hypothetical protein
MLIDETDLNATDEAIYCDEWLSFEASEFD